MAIKINMSCPSFWSIVMAMVIVSTMFYSFRTGSSMAESYAPLLGAAREIKIETTTAHLWFEEIISGDTNSSFNARHKR